MKYHPNTAPSTLSTIEGDITVGYPRNWELRKWYLCWRKYPYPSEVVAALMSEEREGYRHYPCPLGHPHWHLGRGAGSRPWHQQIAQAKRTYRKAVRDEIWRNYVVRQEEAARDRADA